jgi:flagellar basal body-associated protein FliL
MAKKEKEEKKTENAPEAPEAPEKTGKKRKLIIFAGIGSVLALALGVGGFFAFKTFFGKKDEVALSAKATKVEGEPGEAKEGEAAEKGDGTSEAKPDAKSEAKPDAKSEAKPDAKSEAPDKEGEAKKDGGGGEKDAKKDDSKGSDTKDGANADPKKDEGKDGAAKPEEGTGDGKAGKDTREKSVGFGETHDLPKMDLNLGNPLENRFLRMGITVEYHGGDAQKEELTKREPQLKDIVITSVTTKTRMELLTEKGKERLRRELTHRFNEVLERPVKSLFFTDFLVE